MGFWSGLFSRSTALSAARSVKKIQTRRYRAPNPTNSVDGFRPTSGHERVPSALRMISARARDLAHNNPLAKRAVTVRTSHLVGKGVRFAIAGDKSYDAALFEWINDAALCDHDGRLTGYGHQALAVRTMEEAGDGIIVMREVTDDEGKLRLTLQAVDPDLIDVGARPKSSSNECVSGVEVDSTGRVVGMHLKPAGEGSSSAAVFVPVEDLIHFYEPLYPGQLRGIPRGAQALLAVDDQAALMYAIIKQAQAQACLSVFITREDEGLGGGIIGGEEAPEVDGDYDAYIPEKLEPGMVVELPANAKASGFIPTASAGVIDYMRVNLRAIAMAYDVTYSQLTGDLEKVNFSSEKAGRMEFNRVIDTLREHTVIPQLSKIERRFRSVYEANGGVVSPDLEVTIIAPARERIEPAKEVLTDMTEMAAGLKTFGQACLERGLDPDVQMDALVAERRKMASRGINLKFGNVDLVEALDAVVAADDEANAKAEAAAGNSTFEENGEE